MRKKISVITVCYCLSLAQPHAAFASWSETNYQCFYDTACYPYFPNCKESCLMCNGDGYCAVSDSASCEGCYDGSGGGGGGSSSSCYGSQYSCTNDPNLSYSCYGMSASYKNGVYVFYPSAGGLAKSSVSTYLNGQYNGDGYSYGIINQSWATDYPGYKKFCYCAAEECDGVVYVRPVGSSSNDCVDGYHWESSKGCVVDKTCSNCTSTNWAAYGTGYQYRTLKTCNGTTGVCSSSTAYRCAAGYYGSSSNGTSGCTRCPSQYGAYGTSDPGLNSYVELCYFAPTTSLTDTAGTFHFNTACNYDTGS